MNFVLQMENLRLVVWLGATQPARGARGRKKDSHPAEATWLCASCPITEVGGKRSYNLNSSQSLITEREFSLDPKAFTLNPLWTGPLAVWPITAEQLLPDLYIPRTDLKQCLSDTRSFCWY